MNGDEPFEQRLRGLPQRPVPAGWRSEILSAAHSAAAPRPAPAAGGGWLRDALMGLLWPHPKAWAGLAAAWVLIFAFTLAGRDHAQAEVARQARPPSPQLRELLREQEKLLAELTGPAESIRTAPARPAATEPRSQRREEFLKA